MNIKIVLTLVILSFIVSCNISIRFVDEDEFYGEKVLAPESIRLKAYKSALYYCENNIPYEWGGNYYIEPSRSIGVDCSGLIINNYIYAIKGSQYKLSFNDVTASQIYNNYSSSIDTPVRGDLIFWRDGDGNIYHIALLDRREGDYYYFIDSTSTNDINGVSYRKAKVSSVYKAKRLLLNK